MVGDDHEGFPEQAQTTGVVQGMGLRLAGDVEEIEWLAMPRDCQLLPEVAHGQEAVQEACESAGRALRHINVVH
jgi:hypothetical protein